jgi:hypothetical protein
MRTKYIWLVTIVVLAHLAVSLLHGRAHRELGVGLTSFQNVYVITVILLAPLVALSLSWTRDARAGLLLLFVSMLGSLVFGFCYHYVIVSSDHVAHLPPGDARGAFRMTALLLLITEALGVIAALLALRKLSNRNHYA